MKKFILSCALLTACARPLARPFPLERVVDESVALNAALVRSYKATVRIDDGAGGSGSGALIADGLILTAYHVIVLKDGTVAPVLGVHFIDGEIYPAHVKRIEPRHDLALLSLDSSVAVNPLALAATEPPLLARVWSFGAPYLQNGHVGQGRWGALHRMGGADTDAGTLVRVVTGGFAWPGMSGGPVTDDSGAIVAVTDATFSWPLGDVSVPIAQMGLAIDWADVRLFLTGK